MIGSNFTFVITTYRSNQVIDECLKDIPKHIKKIIVENSGDALLKSKVEKNYENTECYLMSENLGYGKANNFGIEKSNTDYVFILNPDTKINDEKFSKIVTLLQNQDFAIAAPQIIEKNKIYKQNKNNNKIQEVELVPGMAMILNKKKFKNNFFDENIFLYLEETDLCKRMRNIGEYVLEVSVELSHLGGQSHGQYDFEMEKSRNWHWMWSNFYFYRKHHNYFYSLIKTLPNFLSSGIKFFNYKLIGNKQKSIQYKMRFLGLFNSYLLNKSNYRPHNKFD